LEVCLNVMVHLERLLAIYVCTDLAWLCFVMWDMDGWVQVVIGTATLWYCYYSPNKEARSPFLVFQEVPRCAHAVFTPRSRASFKVVRCIQQCSHITITNAVASPSCAVLSQHHHSFWAFLFSIRLVEHFGINNHSSLMYCTALRLAVAWFFSMCKLRVPLIIWTCGCMPVKPNCLDAE
jgi:hypothetical protein